jgi:hypothetical protein
MSLDATQVRVGVSGHLYSAAVGTSFPTTTAGAWTGFTDAGYLTPDGPSVAPSVTSQDIETWQSQFPLRTIQTGRPIDIKGVLQQTTGTNLKLAFGGGTVSSLGGGDYKYVPPALGFVDEHALGLEVIDGTFIYRFTFFRTLVKDVGEIVFKKDEEVKFDLTFSLLQPASGNAFEIISNDPALAA